MRQLGIFMACTVNWNLSQTCHWMPLLLQDGSEKPRLWNKTKKHRERCPGPHYHLYACTELDLVLFYFMWVSACLKVRIWTTCLPGARWGQKRMSDPLEGQFLMAVSHRVCAGTWAHTLCTSRVILTSEPSAICPARRYLLKIIT